MTYICVKSMTILQKKKVFNEIKNSIINVLFILKFSINEKFIFVSCKNKNKRQK